MVKIENSCFGVDSKINILGSIYRSPSSSLPDFGRALDNLFHTLSHELNNALIIGNININIFDNISSLDVYRNSFQGYVFYSLVNIPTGFPHKYPGTIIDHALTNLFCTPEAYIIRTSITDHYKVLLRFNSPNYRRTNYFGNLHFTKNYFSKKSRTLTKHV